MAWRHACARMASSIERIAFSVGLCAYCFAQSTTTTNYAERYAQARDGHHKKTLCATPRHTAVKRCAHHRNALQARNCGDTHNKRCAHHCTTLQHLCSHARNGLQKNVMRTNTRHYTNVPRKPAMECKKTLCARPPCKKTLCASPQWSAKKRYAHDHPAQERYAHH